MTAKQMTKNGCDSLQAVGQPRPIRRHKPDVDIYETGEDLFLIADLPGVEESGLELEVSKGILTLDASVTGSGQVQHNYFRQFKLSENLDSEAGEAKLQDGVLTLRLPKVERAKPKKIAVTTLH